MATYYQTDLLKCYQLLDSVVNVTVDLVHSLEAFLFPFRLRALQTLPLLSSITKQSVYKLYFRFHKHKSKGRFSGGEVLEAVLSPDLERDFSVQTIRRKANNNHPTNF